MTPAEQHLGDRLAALVDGELGHDARERVLSHLATCWSCKAEADAQRRLKNVFADSAPPPPSDGLLARLQGLPAGGDTGSASGPGDGPERGDGADGGPMPGVLRRARSPLALDYLPAGRGASALTPDRGFRIHRGHEVERTPSRGRRFAFVAAGAFSVAALALSGPLNSGSAGGSPVAAGERGGASAGPARTPASPAAADRDGRRRGGSGGEAGQQRAATASPRPAATTSVRTQLMASMSVPVRDHPLMRGSSAFTPSLTRPPAPSRALAADKRTPMGAVPGRTPAATAPAPAPATPAATPPR
ncbi:hypothetical protein DVA86_29900 [Streptomyces armeniacus]|uniref:Putative zinc-finger domain-containing protein n=1 Tax=Streptomyces armeniacus TaxID=83291 RepID=A0A345Y1J8_9ACTN|nr:hypothetical protein DVA86_29900 [Streptomyces armeniacus]